MRYGRTGWLLALLLLAAAPARATEVFPLDQVVPGLKGHGLTVVKGQQTERFEVEVLGVFRNVAPGRSWIVARLAGLGLEESGILSGMSGSPVYFDGRLAGAVAFSWSFAKRPIAGITPIESMTGIVPPDGKVSAAPRGSLPLGPTASLLARSLALEEPERLEALRALVAGTFPAAPVVPEGATRLLGIGFSGLPAESLARYPVLARLGPAEPIPVAGPPSSAGSPAVAAPGPLVPGGAMIAYLVRGDLSLGAVGTVTEVYPDGRFLGFGHPFLSFGEVDLPVAPADVVTVIPSVFQSFKVANGAEPRFRLTADRDSGVGGRMDRPGASVPVQVSVTAPGGVQKTFDFQVAAHPKLLPTLLAVCADGAMNVADPSPRERLVSFEVTVETAAGPFAYRDVATGQRAKELAAVTAAALAGIVADNDVEDPRVSRVVVKVRSEPGDLRLRLLDAAPSTRKVAPGGTVKVAVRLGDRRSAERTRVVELKVPRETPEGKVAVIVSDGSAASSLRQLLRPGEPSTLAQLRDLLARLVPTNQLLAGLLVPSRGIGTGPDALTAVPPTAAALLAAAVGQGEPGVSAVDGRLVSEEILSFDRPVSGSVRVEIEVERPRS